MEGLFVGGGLYFSPFSPQLQLHYAPRTALNVGSLGEAVRMVKGGRDELS